MSTIDSIVAANEELTLAIENFNAFAKPMSFGRISFALEEAQEDAKEEKKRTVWEKIKAFFKRIKDWFMSLFKKNKDDIDNIETSAKEAKAEMKNNTFSEEMKRASEESLKKHKTEAPKAAQEKTAESPGNEKEDAAKAAAQKEQAKQKAKEEADKEQEDIKARVAKVVADANAYTAEIDAKIAPKRSEMESGCMKAADDAVRSFLKNDIASVTRLIACTEGISRKEVGRIIAKNVSIAVDNIEQIGHFIETMRRGEQINEKWLAEVEEDKFSVSLFKSLELSVEKGNELMTNINDVPHDELVDILQCFSGFTEEAMVGGLRASGLRRVDLALNDTLRATDELVGTEGVDPAVIARIQKAYNEKIIPISAEFRKLLSIINQALKECKKADNLVGHIYGAVCEKIAEINGIETHEARSSSFYEEFCKKYIASIR